MPGSLMNPGAFNLGAILAGGGQIREQAKSAEELRMIQLAQQKAETDRQVDEAVMAARKRSGQQAIDADSSIPQTIRNLIAGEGGTQYSAATEGQLHQQAFDNRAAAVKAFAEGHPDLGNASLAGIASGPLQLTKVEGNNIIRNPYSTQGSVVADEIGNALIGDHAAAARQHDAAANLSNVKAGAGGFAPHTGVGAKPGKYTVPSHAALSDAFAGSPSAETDFLRWRAAHPEVPDGNVALNAYQLEVATHDQHGPHIITPGLPGSMSITPPSPQDLSLEAQIRADGTPPEVAAQVAAASDSGKPFNIPAGPVPPQAVAAAAPIIAALTGQHGPKAPPAAHPRVPPAAVEYLRSNPGTRHLFEAKYGPAAAASILGH